VPTASSSLSPPSQTLGNCGDGRAWYGSHDEGDEELSGCNPDLSTDPEHGYSSDDLLYPDPNSKSGVKFPFTSGPRGGAQEEGI
jgi:hypothetical protein